MMNRRAYLKTMAAVAAGGALGCRVPFGSAGEIVTVTGPRASDEMGLMLPHEHVMSTFGADAAERAEYDVPALMDAVVPYLEHVRSLGATTLVDCTAAYFGRAPELLREISQRSGMLILTNTGYYGAADDRYVPAHAFEEKAETIAGRWQREWSEGIGNTGIRPGFIKTGVDAGPLSEIDRKLIRAAAVLHRETGLTIAAHTGNNRAAVEEQLGVLNEEGVGPDAWIWVHAHQVPGVEDLLKAADRGAWIELDGLTPDTLDHHLELASGLRARGHLSRVLLSHDGNSFRTGGAPPRPYEALLTHFIPMLREAGWDDGEIDQVTSSNPARAFSVRKRLV
jgi:predicted metal-dependent phosphotriesterase family hydrolase